MPTIRTRVAPSPTGDPHVGTAYIALFNLCFARQHGGEFILRIEDTDQARSTPAYEKSILESLRWLGLDWDEGPDIGGPMGPYRQSERKTIYQEHAETLRRSGHAFPCFCSSERLAAVRRAQDEAKASAKGYDGHCLALDPAEIESRLASGEAHVWRLKVPREGACEIRDLLRGPRSIEWSTIDMQVLLKSDGLPTYHFANVVDDHLMKITHVLRGEEWFSSTPKHLLLYQAFGWQPPVFCHMPLLKNPDGSKLSKRKNPTSILYYERAGFLPEALVNFLGRMGWSMPDGQEKFTLQEMQKDFDIERVSLGGPVFDVAKLRWLNGKWIRENLDTEAFAERMVTWAVNRDYLLPIIPLIHERVDTLADVFPMIAHFVSGNPELSEASFAHKKVTPELCKQILVFASWRLEGLPEWTSDALQERLRGLAEDMQLSQGVMNIPLFVALSGSSVSTPLYGTLAILGPAISRVRLRLAIDALGGAGKKQLKNLQKAYNTFNAVG